MQWEKPTRKVLSKDIIYKILLEKKGKFIELMLNNGNRFYYIYGKIIDFDEHWLNFFDRVDGKVGINLENILRIREADPGYFKMSFGEFDRMADKKLGIT